MQSGTGGVLLTPGHSEYGKSMTTSTSTQDEYAPVSSDIYAKVEKKGGQHDTFVDEIGNKASDMTMEVYEAMSSPDEIVKESAEQNQADDNVFVNNPMYMCATITHEMAHSDPTHTSNTRMSVSTINNMVLPEGTSAELERNVYNLPDQRGQSVGDYETMYSVAYDHVMCRAISKSSCPSVKEQDPIYAAVSGNDNERGRKGTQWSTDDALCPENEQIADCRQKLSIRKKGSTPKSIGLKRTDGRYENVASNILSGGPVEKGEKVICSEDINPDNDYSSVSNSYENLQIQMRVRIPQSRKLYTMSLNRSLKQKQKKQMSSPKGW